VYAGVRGLSFYRLCLSLHPTFPGGNAPQVVFCKLSPLQLRLYNFFLKSKAVQQLLNSSAAQPGGSSGCGAGSGRGRNRGGSRSGGGGDGVAVSSGGGHEPRAPCPPREETLAPLAAITALKKLCCHPDLVYDLAAKAAGTTYGARGATAPQRASARAAAGGAASGGGGSGRGGGGNQLTGFEGCLPIFQLAEVYPTYKAGACQAFHSGGQGMHALLQNS
jgi:hypothetical protein